jgi:hypothetical protein
MKTSPVAVPLVTFSAADWEEIRQSLAVVGVDLDTAWVGAELFTGKLSWLSSGPGWRLSDVLQQIAYFYALPYPPPTAKQRAQQLEDIRAALKEARQKLPFAEGLFNYPDPDRIGVSKDRALDDLLAWKLAEIERVLPKLKAVPSRRKDSRLTALGDYCRELTGLWLACGDGKPHKESLRRFLVACSLAPFTRTPYDEMRVPAEELERKIDGFLSNLSHSKKRRS